MTGPWLGRLLRKAGLRRPAGSVAEEQPVADRPLRPGGAAAGDLPAGFFVNPVAEGADPFVMRADGRYLWAQSHANTAIAIWESDRLHSMGRRHVVWTAPKRGPFSRQVWAPELARLDDRWYIYFAASDGDNRSHLTYVLAATTADPLGPYELHGPLFTGDGDDPGGTNLWAIDLTVLEHAGRRYALWSGWPDADHDLQDLYIREMATPTRLVGPRVRMAAAGMYEWELTEEGPGSRGLREAPQVLSRADRTFVVYSCAASWLPTYKMGLLELTGSDPLDPASWTRSPQPAFQSNDSAYGVGHGSFVRSPDGREWWHVFHAKVDRSDGWRRAIHVQPMSWDADGRPELGQPLPVRQPIEVPSGTVDLPRRGLVRWHFASPDALADFDYYGHHQYLSENADGLHLGEHPERPVDAYRAGEKVVLRDGAYSDLRLTVSFRFLEAHRAAGVLFRCSGPAVGYDAQNGYFAGIALDREALVLGKTDGFVFVSLAESPLAIDIDATHTLEVTALGDRITVTSGATVIDVRDDDYTAGSIGLRVVDTATCFLHLEVEPAP
jgi:GH43 family beta-xylosidase